jgi:hypothetical protein
MKRRIMPATLLIAALIVAIGHAEIALQSKEALQKGATDIATGTVKAIYTEETKDAQWHRTAGLVEIHVSAIENGSKLAPGQSVYAHFWTERWIGNGNPPPFGSGHQVPKKGDLVRAYLEWKDRGFEALLPNGFEVLPQVSPPAARP